MDAPKDGVKQDFTITSFASKRDIAVKAFELEKMITWLNDHMIPKLTEKYPDYVAPITSSLTEIAITAIVAKDEICASSGVISKIGIIGGALEDIASEIEKLSQVEKIPGDIKKELALIIITEVYNVVDKGFDGAENNINLASFLPSIIAKFIPASVSDVIERWVLGIAANIAIESLVNAWKRYGGK